MKAKFAEEVKKREDLQKELGLQVKSNYLALTSLKSASSTFTCPPFHFVEKYEGGDGNGHEVTGKRCA